MAGDDLLPKKKAASATKSPGKSTSGKAATGAAVSPQMRKLMRATRIVGLVFGGAVALVGAMGVVGLITDNFLARLIVAAIVVIGFPAFVSDRFLKRTNMAGGLGLVADVFAIVLLGVSLVLVAAEPLSRPILVREGDRYARSGSRVMARFAYFLGGVSPVFPEDKKEGAPGTGSASASASGAADGGPEPRRPP